MSASRALGLASLAFISACALLTKSDPIVPRYFTPEGKATGGAGATAQQPEPAGESPLELRLGRVNADDYIKDKIVHRESAYEVGYYEERLWTDKPEAYVRRALARELFERRGISEVVSGVGTTLDVDLVAFEEVRAPRHVGRIEISYVLYDDRVVRLSRTVDIERPIADAKGDAAAGAAVQAMGDALAAAANAIADATVAELRLESTASKAGRQLP